MRLECTPHNIRRVLGINIARMYIRSFLQFSGTWDDVKQIAAQAILSLPESDNEYYLRLTAASRVSTVMRSYCNRRKRERQILDEVDPPEREHLAVDPFEEYIPSEHRELVRDWFYAKRGKRKGQSNVREIAKQHGLSVAAYSARVRDILFRVSHGMGASAT